MPVLADCMTQVPADSAEPPLDSCLMMHHRSKAVENPASCLDWQAAGKNRLWVMGILAWQTVQAAVRSWYQMDQAFLHHNQIKFISKCKNSAHSKHVMHLGGTARRIALTAAQCYSFIYK